MWGFSAYVGCDACRESFVRWKTIRSSVCLGIKLMVVVVIVAIFRVIDIPDGSEMPMPTKDVFAHLFERNIHR